MGPRAAGDRLYIKKQMFSQIPGVSAIGGIFVGYWVASTFTNSPIKGFLSSVGIMKGGTHVVSNTTYKLLSVFLPLSQQPLQPMRSKRP
jgi:hypothetical protein